MSFVAITTGEITSGQPVASTTQTKIKDNFDNHETRIETLESSVSQFLPIIFRVNGYYGVMDGVLKTTANSTMNLTGVRLLTDVAGSAGTVQIDIKRKRGGGSYTTIFTTKPSVVYTSGNDALSSNGVLDPAMVDVIAGDILRLDITSTQTAGWGFLVRVDWNRG